MNQLLSAIDSELTNISTESLTRVAAALQFEKKAPREIVKSLTLTQQAIDDLWTETAKYSRDHAAVAHKEASRAAESGDVAAIATLDSKHGTLDAFAARRSACKNALRNKAKECIPLAVQLAEVFAGLCNSEADRVDAEEQTLRQKFGMPASGSGVGAFLRRCGAYAVENAGKSYPAGPRQRLSGLLSL